MASISGDDLFFTEASIAEGKTPLVKALRSFFVDKQFTVDNFISKYKEAYKDKNSGETDDIFIQKMAADRKFIISPERVTPKMVKNVVETMGFEVIELERSDNEALIVVADKETGERSSYEIKE